MAYKSATALEMAVKEASELAARLFDCALDRHCGGLRGGRRLGLETGASSLRLPSDDDEPDFARLPYR